MGLRILVDPAGFVDRIGMYPKNISIDPLGLKRPLIEALNGSVNNDARKLNYTTI